MNFIKSFGVIIRSLVTWITAETTKISDFNPGSAVRTLLDSIGLQLEEFYFDLEQAVIYAIKTSIYEAFGFTRQDEEYAVGKITIYYREPLPVRITIPKGTLFSTNPYATTVLYYASISDTVVEKGTISVTIDVRCTVPGAIGNIGIGLITNMVGGGGYAFDSVTNEEPFYGGEDEQTDSDMQQDFQEYIRALSKGTRDAIAYGAKRVPGVAGVYVDDNYIGFVRVYVHDINGNLTDELKAAVDKELDDWRAAGIEVEVLPIVRQPVNLDLRVIFVSTVDPVQYAESVRQLVINYINGFSVSQSFYMANLYTVINNGFSSYIVNVTALTGEDLEVQNNELVVTGDIRVTGVTST